MPIKRWEAKTFTEVQRMTKADLLKYARDAERTASYLQERLDSAAFYLV